MVSGDLDEYAIAALGEAPVDGYGVGTAAGDRERPPDVGFVYKLVAREGAEGAQVSVAKNSTDKRHDRRPQVRASPAVATGIAEAEADRRRRFRRTTPTTGRCWSLVRGGEIVGRQPLEAARARHVAARDELP